MDRDTKLTVRFGVTLAAATLLFGQAHADNPSPESTNSGDGSVAAAGPLEGQAAEPASADASPSEAASPAAQLIAGLNASLLEVLKQSNELDYHQRFALLAPALADKFDLHYMARQTVGRSFLDLDEEQRKLWYSLFADYMTANYASRFDHYSGQSFEILGEEPGAKETVLVRTQVIDPEQEDVPMSYRVRETDAGWKVIDVYLKGTISELALRRSEYASVLKRDGFEPLVESIQASIAKLEAGAVSE